MPAFVFVCLIATVNFSLAVETTCGTNGRWSAWPGIQYAWPSYART